MALTPQFVNPHGRGSKTTQNQSMIAAAAQYETLDAAAAITITGQTARRVVVEQVIWSYSAAPANGAVTITDGTTTLSWDVTSAGFGQCTFSPPLAFAVATNVVITLADPGGAIVSKLIANAYVEN